MTLKSKLSNNYPTADPAKYLTGADYNLIDPILAGRLAYVAKKTGTKIKLTEGYRSTEYQQQLYDQYLEYKRTGKGSIKLAAKPGTSWHEFRLAVDTSTYPIRGMSNAELKQYGLCKPIASEPWHIQPIETLNQTDRKKFAPTEVKDMTKQEAINTLQEKAKLTEETIQFLLCYKYGEDLVKKLAKAMN